MTSQPNRSKKQIIQDIEEIARQPGFNHIVVLLCRGDLFLKPGEAADKNWRESLSYQELGFLAGLMIKYPLQNAYPDEEDLDNQIEAIDRLFQELHDAYTAPMIESFKPSHAAGPQPQQSPPSQNPPYGAGDYFAEGIFYDGSGAYDFQYLDLAAKRYKEDDQWIVKHRGFSIPTACTIARQLKSLIEGRMRSLTWPQTRTSWAFARLRRSSEERRSDLLLMSRGPIVGLRNDSITVGTPRDPERNTFDCYVAHRRQQETSSDAARIFHRARPIEKKNLESRYRVLTASLPAGPKALDH